MNSQICTYLYLSTHLVNINYFVPAFIVICPLHEANGAHSYDKDKLKTPWGYTIKK